jgi:HTH-type transcriptional regulator, competence development regulator
LNEFGSHLRQIREAKGLSLRDVSTPAKIPSGYLSKIERGLEKPPSEDAIIALARAVGEDVDVLLALAGRVSVRLRKIICRRPKQFAELLEKLDKMPDHALVRIVREVRDGDW